MESIVDASKLTLEPISVSLKTKFINIKYNCQSLIIKTPVMVSPLGIDSLKSNYYLGLSLESDYLKVDNFYQWILEFESKLKFLVPTLNQSLKAENFISCFKNKNEYGKYLRTKIDPKEPSLEIFYKNEICNSIINKLEKSTLCCLLKCQSIWQLNNNWGYSWKVLKIFVKQICPLNEYAFIDAPPSEKNLAISNDDDDRDFIDSIDIHFQDFKPIHSNLTEYNCPDVKKTVQKQFKIMKKILKK